MSLVGPRRALLNSLVLLPETKQYIAAMSPTPDRLHVVAYNMFFKQTLDAVGSLSKLDILYLLANFNSQGARINAANVSAFTAVAVNSPAFVVDRGYTGDGLTSYLDTGFNPGDGGSHAFKQNDGQMGVHVTSSSTVAAGTIADVGITNCALNVLQAASGGLVRAMSSTGDTFAKNNNTQGAISYSRSASSGESVYSNGAFIAAKVRASAAPTNVSMYICGRNDLGVLVAGSTRQIGAVYAGSGLTDAQMLGLYNAVATYLRAVGAGT